MTIQKLVVPAEWKAVDGEENVLEGYASTFDNVDLHGDVVVRGAFRKTLNDLLGSGGKIPLLADHTPSTSNVLGSISRAREDAKGLKIRAEFSSAPSAQDVRTKMLEGHIDRMSIGYEPMQWAFEDRDGRRVRVLKEIKLWEVSAVVMPANPQAVVSRVKSMAGQVVADAVEAGVDAEEIKAEFERVNPTLADWVAELNTKAVGDEEAEDVHDAPAEEEPDGDVESRSDEPGEEPVPELSLKEKLYRADALLAGNDPDAVADPVVLARIDARLGILPEQIERAQRKAALKQELRELG